MPEKKDPKSRLERSAKNRKDRFEAAMVNVYNVALATDLFERTCEYRTTRGGPLTSADLRAVFRLLYLRLEEGKMISRAPGGRGRTGRTYAARDTKITFGQKVKAVVFGKEVDGIFISWAKGGRGQRGFARIAIDKTGRVVGTRFLPPVVEDQPTPTGV